MVAGRAAGGADFGDSVTFVDVLASFDINSAGVAIESLDAVVAFDFSVETVAAKPAGGGDGASMSGVDSLTSIASDIGTGMTPAAKVLGDVAGDRPNKASDASNVDWFGSRAGGKASGTFRGDGSGQGTARNN